LTGGESTVQSVCQQLCDAGFSNAFVTVGENLSYPNERVVSGFAETFINGDFVNLSVMLIQNKEPQKKYLAVRGLPDEAFLRGDVPMTKSEIRSVSISKLQLKEDDVLFDVGAGTGSISIEAGLVLSQGTVYAIEKKEEAMLLIENNIARFSLKNVYVVCGKAPEAFESLPVPTKAFIGGSSGNMKEIIAALLTRNSKIRIVINIIALETLSAALNALKECGLQNTEVVQLSVSKSKQLGGYHMMVGQNPIYIITAEGQTANYNMNGHLPRVMLAATASGCGKTSLACGIMRAFINRGNRVTAFKSGPDYIDPDVSYGSHRSRFP
jgi:precorrin-6Y C5,15-methyltransferase (decarboxylating)